MTQEMSNPVKRALMLKLHNRVPSDVELVAIAAAEAAQAVAAPEVKRLWTTNL
jgi:hypothetical protein